MKSLIIFILAVVIFSVNATRYVCTSTGDPHYRSFFGNSFHMYQYGDFVLTKSRNFEVHTRTKQWHRTAVNTGWAVRCGSDIIECTGRYSKNCRINGKKHKLGDNFSNKRFGKLVIQRKHHHEHFQRTYVKCGKNYKIRIDNNKRRTKHKHTQWNYQNIYVWSHKRVASGFCGYKGRGTMQAKISKRFHGRGLFGHEKKYGGRKRTFHCSTKKLRDAVKRCRARGIKSKRFKNCVIDVCLGLGSRSEANAQKEINRLHDLCLVKCSSKCGKNKSCNKSCDLKCHIAGDLRPTKWKKLFCRWKNGKTTTKCNKWHITKTKKTRTCCKTYRRTRLCTHCRWVKTWKRSCKKWKKLGKLGKYKKVCCSKVTKRRVCKVRVHGHVTVTHRFLGGKLVSAKSSKLLEKWTGSKKNWRLCYKASKHGWNAREFHKRCDKYHQTVSVFQSTNGNIFGGYTNTKWNKSGYRSSSKSFLFSLKNKKHGPAKFKSKIARYATFAHPSYFPTFGGGHDIWCPAHKNGLCYSNFGHSYVSKYRYATPQARNYFAGSYRFRLKDLEVYY